MKTYKKKCKHCEVVFETTASNKAFCSQKCHSGYLEKKNQRICKQCGKIFGVGSSLKKGNYCSRECQYKSQLREHVFTCKNCGKEYSAKHPDRNQFCSRECSYSFKTTKKIQRIEQALKNKTVSVSCAYCQAIFKTTISNKKYCSSECSYKDRLQKVLERKYPRENKECLECGKTFVAPQKIIYCSKKCGRKALKRERKHRLRASGKRHGKTITIVAVGTRDGWRCSLCGKKVNKDATGYPSGPSIDHIIPVSKGGPHTWSNVQLAHIGCNSAKRDKIEVHQLRLEMRF